jgi:hypothetical protein
LVVSADFANQMYTPKFFVVHFTGGTPNLQSLYNYWLSQCGVGSNSHFGIERTDNQWARAGDIWQFLPTYDGACANCCTESGHAPFLPSGNLNVRTISVECINPDTGNNGDMPQAQFDSLVYLIKTICQQENIPIDRYTTYWNDYENTHTWGDGGGGIIMHRDIAPHNRRMCPGTPYYSGQMDKVIAAVKGGGTQPQPPLTVTPEIEKAMKDAWDSNGKGYWYDSGIANAWKYEFTHNYRQLGPAFTDEYSSKDWSGNAVVAQEFPGGRAEYRDGKCQWQFR